MKFDHTVKIGGVIYPAGTEISENAKKKTKLKEPEKQETKKGESKND